MSEKQTKQVDSNTVKTRSPWFNPKRLEFWILWPVALYAVLGFLVAPQVARKLLISGLNDTFNVQARVADIDINPFTLSFSVHGFALDDMQDDNLLTVERLSSNLGIGGFFQKTIAADNVDVVAASASFRRYETGDSNFSRAFSEKNPQDSRAESSEPWAFKVSRFSITDMNISYVDEAHTQPASVAIDDLDLTLENFSSADGAMSPVNLALRLGSGGEISATGAIGLFPELVLESDLDIKNVSLLPIQAYAADFASINIQSGALDMAATIRSAADEPFTIHGQVKVSNLQLEDSERGEKFVGWDELDIDEFSFSTALNNLEISQIRFLQPYGRVDIAADQSTNIGRIFSSPEAGTTPADPVIESQPQSPFQFSVGEVSVENGSANFSDASLPLTFATEIHKLSGGVSAFISGSSAPALVSMEGQVDEYGLVRIEGAINLDAPTEQSEFELIFNNLEMQSLNPYTVAFAGRRIDAGKLDLELDYILAAQELKGENKILIKNIELGEKVEHPGAMSLPLDLAVALLKDSNGHIDIDLPVSGDINDPEFSYGGVVLKALAGLIVKAVASPFRLLGRLIGDDSEDFDQIRFLPGQATLAPPELEKVHKLAQALELRPLLNTRVSGVVDPVVDMLALQENKLDTLLQGELAGAADGMLLERTRAAIEQMYTTLPEHTPLADLQQQFSAAAETESGTPMLDELAYVAAMKNRLIQAQPVPQQDLEMLAADRAAAIVNALQERLPGETGRILQGANNEVKAGDGNWIAAELELVANPAE